MDENFIVDFGEVTRVTTEDFNKLNNRPSYAGELMTGDTNIPQVPSSVSELNNDSNYQTGAQVSEVIGTETEAREAADTALDGRLTTVEGIAATALQPSSIDKVVMTDINVGANTSTTTFNLDASKQNLLTGATSSKQVSMPVASSTEAGIMNSATFDAVVNNTAHINALTNGAVAITGLPSSPTQAQLTTAWENATGETSLMNRAGIYDVTNGKVWTYYTNDTMWHSTTNTTQVTINTFTNSSEGTIKGSTNVGQVFAEADGTGSVNGWDALNDAVGNNSSAISGLQTAVDGKQDKLIAGTNINIAADGKTISATDTTYTAGNAIDITNGEISADIHPADFFTAEDTVSDCGSNLSLDNTIATTLKSVEVKGDTSQTTYTGKNLISTINASGGVEITGLNSFIANKDTARTVNIYFSPRLPAGTYTISYDVEKNTVNTDGIRCGIFVVNESGTGTTSLVNLPSPYVGHKEYTFTSTTQVDRLYFYIYPEMPSGSTATITNLQVEAGSTATDFEPFVGGIPAPNPEYPQNIQVVTGEQTVTVTGKNLFDKNTVVLYNGYFNAGGRISGDNFSDLTKGANRFFYIPCEPNTTYSITKPLQSTTSYNRFRIGTLPVLNITNGTALNDFWQMSDGSTTTTHTITTGANANYLFVYFAKATTETNPGGEVQEVLDGLQIEKGATATDYEPYRGQSYEIDLGKNIWSSFMEVGGISATGTSLSNDKRVRSATKVVVQPGTTYTLSAIPRDSGKVINVAIQGWTSDGTFLSQITGADWQTLPLTFTTPANCYKVTLNGRYSDDTVFGTVGESTDAFQNIQLEAGANATEYAPYFIPIELCKIGDYQDYIYKSGDDWYLHKETNAKSIDGTEAGWGKSGVTENNAYYLSTNIFNDMSRDGIGVGQFDTHITPTFSRYFVATSSNDIFTTGTVGLGFNAQPSPSVGLDLRIGTGLSSPLDTVQLFKDWLGVNKPNIYYVLATPTDTKITDATLITQLNALAEAKSYNGQTNVVVTATGENLPAALCVEAYRKSLNGLLGVIERLGE